MIKATMTAPTLTTMTAPTAFAAETAPAGRFFETEAVSLGPNTYLAYPHANIFGRDGRSFVFARAGNENSPQFVWKEGTRGRETPLPILKRKKPRALSYYDVALQTDLVATTADDALWICEPGATAWRRLYGAPQGATLQPNPSLSADGKRALVGQVTGSSCACVEVDTRSGAAKTLFSPLWHASHFHLVPHDESWIGYCHEEWADFKAGKPTTGDRVWAWHAQHAPQGRFLFGGKQADGTNLNVGHERWGFHDTSALVVAYRSSSGGPKGIYEVWAQGRAPKLVSELTNFWHVNINRNGKWVAADTVGAFDPEEAPIPGDEGSRSDIVLVEKATGKTRLLARSHFTPHPYHPHPIFSADAEWVLYNDSASVLEGGAPGAVMVRTGVTP